MSSHTSYSEVPSDEDPDGIVQKIPRQKISDRYQMFVPFAADKNMMQPYIEFLKNFYAVSDDPTADSEWLAHFSKHSSAIMGSIEAVGLQELKELRQSMWTDVVKRRHYPMEVFTSEMSSESAQLMLHGYVHYVYQDGSTAKVPWAARAFLSLLNGQHYFLRYQVYIDSGSQGLTRPFKQPDIEDQAAEQQVHSTKRRRLGTGSNRE